MAVITQAVASLQSIPSPSALERRVLVVGPSTQQGEVLEQAGYLVSGAASAAEGAALLERRRHDVVVLVQTGEAEQDWAALRRLTKAAAGTPVIVMGPESLESAVEAMREGAYDFLSQSASAERLEQSVRQAAALRRRNERQREARAEMERRAGFDSLVGQSPAFLAALGTAARAAESEATILLRGETGTGKAALAEAIHRNSVRRDGPFVVWDGEDGKKAEGGTLYVEEASALTSTQQVRLLRLLESDVDVRVIAGTQSNLGEAVEDGRFRADLYYRLGSVQIELPPLRERLEDLPALAAQFAMESEARNGRPRTELTPALLQELKSYTWPGNVEELRSVMDRLVALAQGGQLSTADLPNFLRRERPILEVIHLELPPHGISLEAVEKELLFRALQKFNWNQTHAARYLSLSRKTLIYRMEKHGLHKRDLASAAGSD
ncbi:MAG: sigma-54 dependent transcriptional regulator [Bryobacteraceae bacterium]|nr:sigma-54 dependent transcriptional regulator [Bryobacteraceae bacterium]